MTTLDLEFVVSGLVPLAIVVGVLIWFRRRRRDEMWVGVTPGERPVGGQGPTRRLGGSGEWNGTVAVRFTPPDGVTPGIAGTVVDGKADPVDISATIIDLAVRGHLTIRPVHVEGASVPGPDDEPVEPFDWELERHPDQPDELRPFERELLRALFATRNTVHLRHLKHDFGYTMRSAQISLYREVVDRGWYREHPRARNRRLALVGIPLLVLGIIGCAVLAQLVIDRADFGPLEVTPGVCLLLAGGLLLWGGHGRTPRTADGTAVRVQTLGFREYLTTAEADQIRFEEARDIFSRYLPYAIVFGCAERWAKIFGEVAANAHLAGVGDATFDLSWFDGFDMLGHLGDAGDDVFRLLDAFDGPGIDMGDVFDGGGLGFGDLNMPDVSMPDLGGLDVVDTMSGGLGDLASGLGDFASAVGDVFDAISGCGDVLSGCDGCDGCDIGF